MTSLGRVPSNIAQGQIILERLQTLLKECDAKEVPFHNRRASREWIGNLIGCKANTLSTNIVLKRELNRWEQALPAELKHHVDLEADLEFEDPSVVRFPRQPLDDLILPVKITTKKGVFNIPVLFAGDRVDEWVTSYLRHLRVKNKRKFSGVEEVAKKLRIFRRYQRLNRVKNEDVTDDFILMWQNWMTSAGLSINRRNDCLGTVHNFFKWAEERGHLRHHIQLRAKSEYKDLPDDYPFPISSEEKTVMLKGVATKAWVSTLMETGGHSTFGTRNTPTFGEIETLVLNTGAHKRNAARNILLLNWALQTGSRVSELVQIKLSDLLSTETALGEYLDSGEEYINVTVDRKNKGTDTLRVDTDLMLATFDYIKNDADRKKIVASNRSILNEDYLFLSEKGGPLTTDSITRICRRFFAESNIEKANIHRLRARFITEIIEGCLDDMASKGQSVDLTSDWSESILTMARGRMGHSHIMSLRPYLNEIKIRRIQVDGNIIPRDVLESKRQQVELQKQLVARIAHNSKLVEVDHLTSTGNNALAIVRLEQMVQELKSRAVA